jgi:perosamine synthetase
LIKLASPDIRFEDIRRAVEVIKSGNLIQGKSVVAFEEALCSFSGVGHCAVVSSGTAALHLSLLAIGIKHGDVVIVPSFTFPATANVVENIGAEVLFCDVDPQSYVVTPQTIESTISGNPDKNIRAIIVVHEFGCPAEIKTISRIAKANSLKLIEDAACALGTVADGFHPGYYSDAACFSFHPRKAITTGEGGAVMSNDEEFIEKIKVLRNHGMAVKGGGIDFIAAGLNYRMTDFQAALAIGQLERFAEELRKRKVLASLYRELFHGGPGLSLPGDYEGHSWQSFMVVLDKTSNREAVISGLLAEGIQTNLGAQALNCLSYYQNKYDVTDSACPVATKLYKHGLVLPLYGKLSEEDVSGIAMQLSNFLRT